jgi:hypothetical protein
MLMGEDNGSLGVFEVLRFSEILSTIMAGHAGRDIL